MENAGSFVALQKAVSTQRHADSSSHHNTGEMNMLLTEKKIAERNKGISNKYPDILTPIVSLDP